MKKTFVVIFLLIAVVAVSGQKNNQARKAKNNSKFVRYAKEFKKDYKNKSSASIDRAAERVLRRAKRIQEINDDVESTYKADHTEWDDLTSEERERQLCGTRYIPSDEDELLADNDEPQIEDELLADDDEPAMQPTYRALPGATPITLPRTYTATTVPTAVDWSSHCLGVTNQGSCGSCWAFATFSMLECYNRIRYGDSRITSVLAPQFLVDCDNTNTKCNGGWPKKALDKLKLSFATSAPLWSSYAYYSFNYESNPVYYACRSTVPRVKLNYVNTYQVNLNGNENSLKLLIANNGPMTVAVYVASTFYNYKSGIYYDAACPVGNATVSQCDFSKVNHAVVLTGYGAVNGTDVWILRNSWGATWGYNGYMYMARNRANNCNPACYAMYAN